MIKKEILNQWKKEKLSYYGNLSVGQKAKIIKLNLEKSEIRRHLLDMGLTRGAVVKIKKIAPMGDPIDIELRGYQLCIRKMDLNQIEVEVI